MSESILLLSFVAESNSASDATDALTGLELTLKTLLTSVLDRLPRPVIALAAHLNSEGST